MFIAKNNGQIILARDTEEQLINDLQFMVYTDIEEKLNLLYDDDLK